MSSDLSKRMEGAINALRTEFAGLRTGRASVDFLAPIKVDAYGSLTPLEQLGSVSVLDARALSINVWDKTMVQAVEKAIREAGLGLNPAVDGQLIRIPMPELNEERRLELAKLARQYAENAKISVRNVRRDGVNTARASQKNGEMSEDDLRHEEADIQKLTDDFVKQIDEALAKKEMDITTV